MPSSILNSDDGVISGTAGLKNSGGDDGVLLIQNNGTDAITVADDGDVNLAADLSVTGDLLFNSGFGSAGTAYGCRAWVNFNGIGTVAIRASGNVSSITDNGTGSYTVNFSVSFPDNDYAVAPTVGDSQARGVIRTDDYNTSSVNLFVRRYDTDSAADDATVCAIVVR